MIRIFRIIPARVFTLFLSEIALLYACFLVAAYADPDLGDVELFLLYDAGFLRITIVVGFLILGLFLTNLYGQVRIRSRMELLRNLLVIFGVTFVGQGTIGYLDPQWIIPRKVMLLGSVLACAVLFGWRLLFDRTAQRVLAAERVLFLGMSPIVAKIAAQFGEHPEFGLIAIGYLESGTSSSSSSSSSSPVTRLGSMENLESVLDLSVPDSIVIGEREDVQPWWTEKFLALRFGGMRVEEAGALYERIFGRKCLTEIRPSKAIFGDPAPGAVDASFQLLYSRAIALGGAIITLPFTLPIAALIGITSRGPILTRELRVGSHNETFEAYGFRCAGPDGGYTAVGRFLRRHGLVWLPQLINVLKGEMAMVGPRPERPLFARRMGELIPFYGQRHTVKPGVTGWARIHRSRGDEQDSLSDLEYDLHYLGNQSAVMDFFILLLSLKAVR